MIVVWRCGICCVIIQADSTIALMVTKLDKRSNAQFHKFSIRLRFLVKMIMEKPG